MDLIQIGKSVLSSCMDVKAGESVLVITDDKKLPIGNALYQAAKELGAEALLMTMEPRKVSGEEPPAVVAAAMLAADVIVCPMSTSTGGLGSMVAQAVAEHCPKKVKCLALPDAPVITGTSKEVFEHYGLNASGIAKAAEALLK